MTLLTSLNYSLSLGFVATFMLAGLVATALVHTFRNLSGIELRPLAAGETFAGAVMPFTLALAGGATPRYAVTLTGARLQLGHRRRRCRIRRCRSRSNC